VNPIRAISDTALKTDSSRQWRALREGRTRE
jgi:hypothetical protein